MQQLAAGFGFLDLQFLDVPHIIACGVIHGRDGVGLVDPGPSTTLPRLKAVLREAGLGVADITHVLLTHIHLDHAAATGTLVRENPRVRVCVHERGAGHMQDPSKLIDSATRLYGADMDRMWGAVEPVPSGNITALRGGEHIEVGGRRLDVAYTPGHASHHVSYFDPSSGIACTGDVAGVRLPGTAYVLPPTPPPDIDPVLWRRSVEQLLAWAPETLFVTHFGPHQGATAHLHQLLDRLEQLSDQVRAWLQDEASEEQRAERFVESVRRELRRTLSAADAERYEVAGRFDLGWLGLARYWRKQAAGGR